MKTVSTAKPITGVLIADLEGRVLKRSDNLAELLGRENNEVVGRAFSPEWFAPESTEAAKGALSRCLGDGSSYDTELICRDKFGNEVKVWVDCSLVTDWDGKPVNITCTLRNEAAREETLVKLAESEARYRLLFDSSPEAILLLRPDGTVIDCNPAACRLAGLDRVEIAGANLSSTGMVRSEDMALAQERFQMALRGESVPPAIYQIHPPGKEPIWVESFLSAMTINGRSPIIQSCFRDITARQKSDELLRQSEERLRLAIGNMPVLVHAFDDNGSIVFWNRECERVTGYSANEVIGNPLTLRKIYPDEEYRKSNLAKWAERNGDIRGWEWEITCKDGSKKVIAWFDQAGRQAIPGWRNWNVGVDVTDRRLAAEQARRVHNELNQIFQAATPMNLIATDFTILKVNSTYAEKFNVSEKEVVGRKCYDIFPGPLCNTSECAMMKIIAGQEHYLYEDNTTLPDGGVVTSLVSAVPYRDPAGNVCGIVESFTDISDRKESETALRLSETRYRELADLLPQIVFELNTEGDLTFANRLALESTGYTRADLERGLNLRRLFAGDDLQRIMANFEHLLKAEPVQGDERRLIRKDGTWFPVMIYSNPIVQLGEVVGVRGVAVDITRQKEALAALEESEERYRTLFEASPKGITQIALDGTIVDCNPATCDLVGRPKDELVGRHFSQLGTLGLQEMERARELFERLMQGEELGPIELAIPRADGQQRWTESFPSLLMRDGEPFMILVLTRDISDRKLAEMAARESEERYRSLLANLPIGVFRTRPDGTILSINPAITRMMGFELEEAAGPKLAMDAYADPNQRAELLALLEQGQAIHNFETRFLRADGTSFWVSLDVRAILDDSGKVAHYDGTVTDISERKQAENAVRESEERYRSLVEGASEAIFTLDRTGRFTYANGIAATRLGMDAPAMVGRTMSELLPPQVARKQLAQVNEVFESGKGSIIESAEGRKDLKRRFSTSVQPIRGQDGSITSVMCISREISPLVRIKEELESERDFVRSLLETANSLIVCLDSQAKIRVFNRECEKVTGYSREEVLGERWPDTFLPEEARHPGLENFAEWVSRNPKDMYEGPLRTKSGETRIILWSNSAIVSNDPDKIVAIAVGQDITERKSAEQNLQLAHEKLKNEEEALRQANITLRELIGNIEAEKSSIKRQIQDNIDKIAIPLLANLKSSLDPDLKISAALLEECISDVASPYLGDLAKKSRLLTLHELRICSMIANGLNTKQIAGVLNISCRTIEKHRQQIRHRLGLTHSKSNLQSYLISIRDEVEERLRNDSTQ